MRSSDAREVCQSCMWDDAVARFMTVGTHEASRLEVMVGESCQGPSTPS